jgi:hypothetical protein
MAGKIYSEEFNYKVPGKSKFHLGMMCGVTTWSWIIVCLLIVPNLLGYLYFEDFSNNPEYLEIYAKPHGEFVELSWGKVHYILEGPKEGNLGCFSDYYSNLQIDSFYSWNLCIM